MNYNSKQALKKHFDFLFILYMKNPHQMCYNSFIITLDKNLMRYKRFLSAGISALSIMTLATPAFAATTIVTPNANGHYFSSWSGFSGGALSVLDHYLLVDESLHNDDTDYVRGDSSTGSYDSYYVDLSGIPNGSTINNINITGFVKKEGAGSQDVNYFYRFNGSGTYQHTSDLAVTSTSIYNAMLSEDKTVSISKSAGTTLEIGITRSTGSLAVRLTKISAKLSY